MDAAAAAAAKRILGDFDPNQPGRTAEALRDLWRRAARADAPGQARDWRIAAASLEAVGTPVPVLEAIGKEMGQRARGHVPEFLPLARLLWEEYGREGRVVAAVALGPMELAEPDTVVPVLYELAKTCAFWEDCDQLAMRALEPVLRRDPASWLDRLAVWITDENKWVRRAGLTAIGRLPMKHAAYAAPCVERIAPALGDADIDVKRAISFALRVTARGEIAPLKAFIRAQEGVTDADRLWVLCDVIRSMTRELLPEFVDLLPIYQAWMEAGNSKARRSVEGAIRVLSAAAG